MSYYVKQNSETIPHQWEVHTTVDSENSFVEAFLTEETALDYRYMIEEAYWKRRVYEAERLAKLKTEREEAEKMRKLAEYLASADNSIQEG